MNQNKEIINKLLDKNVKKQIEIKRIIGYGKKFMKVTKEEYKDRIEVKKYYMKLFQELRQKKEMK